MQRLAAHCPSCVAGAGVRVCVRVSVWLSHGGSPVSSSTRVSESVKPRETRDESSGVVPRVDVRSFLFPLAFRVSCFVVWFE